MTTPIPQPDQQNGQAPIAPSPYAQAPHGYALPKRPPLTARAKRGAVWAGMVGFNLLTWGFTIFVIPIVLAVFGAFFSLLVAQIGRSSAGQDADFYRLQGFLGTVNIGAWIIPAIIVSIVGLGITAVALVVSKSILKSLDVNRPWGVTWAGSGVAIVAFWFLSWIPGILLQILTTALSFSNVGVWATVGISGGLYIVVGIVGNALIGWLAWWWMAHAMRPEAAVVAPMPTTTQE